MTQENPGDMSSPPPPPPPPVTTPPAGASTGASGYPDVLATPDTPDSKTMAMLAHLLGILTGFVGPLIIWLVKKDSSRFVDDQAKEALNFHISVSIIIIVCSATAFLCIPALIALAVWITAVVFSIMGAMKANQGIAYRYPINIRLIK
jgi:uncharacterized Tic20 family protein